MTEFLGQTAALLCACANAGRTDQSPLFARAENAVFLGDAFPGDRVIGRARSSGRSGPRHSSGERPSGGPSPVHDRPGDHFLHGEVRHQSDENNKGEDAMSGNNLDDQLRELIADVLEILARIGTRSPQDELSRMVNLESVRAIVQAHAKA